MLYPFCGESSLAQLYAKTTKGFFYSHSQACFPELTKAWVRRILWKSLSEFIIEYTEAFPCHDLEFFVLRLAHSPLLEYTTFLLDNFIKNALFVSSTEIGYAP